MNKNNDLNKQVSLRKWFADGWGAFKQKPPALISISLLTAVNGFMLSYLMQNNLILLGILILIIEIILFPILTAGIFNYILKIVRKEKAEINDIFKGFSRFITVWTAVYFTFILVSSGFILFIIPGLILALKYYMVFFAVIDKNFTAEDTISYSSKITGGHKGKIFFFIIISSAVSMLSLPFINSFNTATGYTFSSTVILLSMIFYIIQLVIINPWFLAAQAAAYDNLSKSYSGFKNLDEAILSNLEKENENKADNHNLSIN